MKRLLIILLSAITISACAYKAQPIYNVDKALPDKAQSMSMDRIESAIIQGGAAYQWEFQKVGEGHLIATQRAPKFQATVDVFFDRQRYKIVHNSTVGLRDTGETIHSHYNVWIRNLEKGIDTRLSQVALEA